MDKQEALKKLERYEKDFGDWVYTTTVEKALRRSVEYAAEAEEEPDQWRAMIMKAKSHQFLEVHQLHVLLGADVPPPPMVEYTGNVRRLPVQNENIIFHPAGELFEDTFGDGESITFQELMEAIPTPKYKIGDSLYLKGDVGGQDGYLPVVIVGLDWTFDDISYMIGTYDDEDDLIDTVYEVVPESDLFRDPADDVAPEAVSVPVKRDRSHLKLVKS